MQKFPFAGPSIARFLISPVKIENIFDSISLRKLAQGEDRVRNLYRLLYFIGELTFKKGCEDEFHVPNELARKRFVLELEERLEDFFTKKVATDITNSIETLVIQKDVSSLCDEISKVNTKFVKFGSLADSPLSGFQFGNQLKYSFFKIINVFI